MKRVRGNKTATTRISRQQGRAARKRMTATANVTFIDYGHLLEGDPNYGLSVVCYVCGARHPAFGLARIRRGGHQEDMPLCQRCLNDDDAVCRKYLNAPELKITDGGELTSEQFAALAQKSDATEH